ncbi:MAG: FAD-dependent oxidoreductase, partial [Pseudomonadota bacterium]
MTTPATTRAPATDTLVIGGGVMGLFAARTLARSGRRVRLIEARESSRGFDGGASRAGGGILSPLTPWTESPLVQALAADSQARYPAIARHLAARTGIDTEYRRTGGLFVGDEAGRAMAAWCAEHQVAAAAVSGPELAALDPAVAADRAVHVPALAQVRNPRLLDALLVEVLAEGVAVEAGVRTRALVSRRGQVTGAVTDAGPRYASEVVVAAGAWSSQLLGAVGWTAQVRPVRGQMLWFAPFEGAPKH